MNPDFKALLQENGVDGPVLRTLELDGVTSERIFYWLKSQQMARLYWSGKECRSVLMHFFLICGREQLCSHPDPNPTVRIAVSIQ